MYIRISVLFMSLMLFSGVSISAKNDDQSLRDLRLYKVVFAAKGFSCRDSVEGRFLSQGQTYTVHTKLHAENDYILMAAGNEHVKDIDILLHDENHGEIAKDGKRDSTPMVSVSPKWSGDFHAVVTMYRGRGYSNLMVCWKKRN